MLEDYYRIDDTLQEFCQEVGGNPYSFDEYEICVGIKESIEKRDFEALTTWSRKSIFGFIEVEIVKPFKMWVNNPPLKAKEVIVDITKQGGETAKQKALDDLLC